MSVRLIASKTSLLNSAKRFSHFKLSFQLQSYSSQRQWPDLAQICKTGQIPKNFNFATHVFQKQTLERGSETALWFDDDQEERKISYAEFNAQSIRAALAIQKVLKGRRNEGSEFAAVAMTILPRIPEWWFLHMGCIRSNTVFCSCTVLLTPEDIHFRLEASNAQLIVTDERNMDKVDEAESRMDKKGLTKILVGTTRRAGWVNYQDLVTEVSGDQVAKFEDCETKSEDISLLFFTSGTTGSPKMVAHSYASYGIGHYKTAHSFGLESCDVVWSPTDAGWAKCSYCSFYAPIIAGSTIYVKPLERLEPQRALQVLQSKDISVFFATPTMYRAMMEVKDQSLFRPKALRLAIGGSEAVNPQVVRQWKQKTGMTMKVTFGQTETTTMVSSDSSAKEGSLGNPSKYYDIKIVDKIGEELEVGKVGNIAIKIKPERPVGLFQGYFKGGPNGPEWDTKKNNSCFVGDFYLTGDRGYADGQGNIFYVSRADDVIISAGYRIGPFEVESALLTHPAVIESAVVASPDPLRGEVVKAFIVIHDKVKYAKDFDKRKLVKDLQEHVKKHTAPYKYPRKVEFVDTLPKTASGKILRRELKELEFS